MSFSFLHILGLSVVLRLVLIAYGEWQDAHSLLKYTDVDYRVFSDAARFILNPSAMNMAQGPLQLHVGDPYERSTYRYTPLLALFLTPNEILHPAFGKILFASCDILVGILLYKLFPAQRSRRNSGSALLWIAAVWLLDPIPANISTRGSAESVLGAMIIGTLALAMNGYWDAAAMGLGLAAHFKIYPIIYAASMVVLVGSDDRKYFSRFHRVTSWILDRARVRLTLISAGTFLFLNALMYAVWGGPFLQHAWLYHLSRVDHRHNFSPYFYPLYLSSSLLQNPLISFLPQMVLSMGTGFFFAWKSKQKLGPAAANHLPFIWFVQTMIFVSLNKVCTSQYFMWYLWFLPLVLPRVHFSIPQSILLAALWVGAQAVWLSIAFQLEFNGSQVFFPLWAAGIVFLATNAYILVKIVKGYVQ